MVLLLVLLPMILAVSLTITECCASSPGSRMDLHLHSQKNASEHWIIRVNAQRSIRSENEREVIIDVHQQTTLSHNNEMEQVVSMTTVYPPLHDPSMPGAIEPSITRPTTTTAATLSSATATPSTATPPATTTTTSTTTPKSCPPGYQLYQEFNCYKAFPSRSEWRTWSEARDQCVRDGGDLMVMESERERLEVFLPLRMSVSWRRYPWVGVYKPQGEDSWMTVNGEPVPSTWWWPAKPHEGADRKCAYAYSDGLLVNYICAENCPFICEISL